MVKYYYATMDSPLGEILLSAHDSKQGIAALYFPKQHQSLSKEYKEINETGIFDPNLFKQACQQLQEYFLGKRKIFDLPLAPVGTDFQQRVWLALRDIGYGKTKSYGDIAKIIGQPTAYRAVGLAIGKNPLGIIVPCHRVIGADGTLTGFAGGLAAKEWLLNLEAAR